MLTQAYQRADNTANFCHAPIDSRHGKNRKTDCGEDGQSLQYDPWKQEIFAPFHGSHDQQNVYQQINGEDDDH